MDTQKEDVFRKNYKPLTEEQKELLLEVKIKAQELYDLYGEHPTLRENALAKTHLETSVMWAIKGITK